MLAVPDGKLTGRASLVLWVFLLGTFYELENQIILMQDVNINQNGP